MVTSTCWDDTHLKSNSFSIPFEATLQPVDAAPFHQLASWKDIAQAEAQQANKTVRLAQAKSLLQTVGTSLPGEQFRMLEVE